MDPSPSCMIDWIHSLFSTFHTLTIFLLSIETNPTWCLRNAHDYTIPGCPVNLPILWLYYIIYIPINGLLTLADGNHNIISDVKFQLQKYDYIFIFNASIPLIPFNLCISS